MKQAAGVEPAACLFSGAGLVKTLFRTHISRQRARIAETEQIKTGVEQIPRATADVKAEKDNGVEPVPGISSQQRKSKKYDREDTERRQHGDQRRRAVHVDIRHAAEGRGPSEAKRQFLPGQQFVGGAVDQFMQNDICDHRHKEDKVSDKRVIGKKMIRTDQKPSDHDSGGQKKKGRKIHHDHGFPVFCVHRVYFLVG